MAAPIGPGDWVECVDDAPGRPANRPYTKGARVVAGRIYQVAFVRDEDPEMGGRILPTPSIGLTAPATHWVAWNGDAGAWLLSRFRQIYRPKREIIEALKAPPARVRRTEDA